MEEYFEMLQLEHDLMRELEDIKDQQQKLNERFSDTFKKYQKTATDIDRHAENPKNKESKK